jgi:hypothetical protein
MRAEEEIMRWMLLALVVACGSSSSTSTPIDPPPDPEPEASPTDPPSDYPKGPYGMGVGHVFPDLTLSGYRNGSGSWTTLRMKDYYDPAGTRGIKGIYMTVSAPWCTACVSEGKSLPARWPDYQAKGARFLSAVVQDESHEPATRATVDTWIATFHTNYDIVADGAITTLPHDEQGNGSVGLPFNYVIDPRTMKVASIMSGPLFTGGSGMQGLDQLLEKNR